MASHFLKLSDDCLMKILDELPTEDQFHFANVCCRFQSIFKEKTKSKYTSVFMKRDDLPLVPKVDNKYFFGAIGSKVNQIQCLGSNIKLLAKYAKYLTHVKVFHYYDTSDSDTVVDELFPLMEVLRSVENLLLSNCTITADVKFNDLNHVTNLSLVKCTFTSPDAFKMICTHFKQVMFMVIDTCSGLLVQGFRALVANSTCIQEMVLRINENTGPHDVLAQLSALRILYIQCSNTNTMLKILTALTKHKRNQLRSLDVQTNLELAHVNMIERLKRLEELTIHGIGDNSTQLNDEMLGKFASLTNLKQLVIPDQAHISANAILHLVAQCPTLMYLNVSNCMSVTNDFIIVMAPMVMGRAVAAGEPFELIAKNTQVNAEIYENIRYWEIDFRHFDVVINPTITKAS